MKTLLLIAEGEKVFMDACPSRVFISIPGTLSTLFPRAPSQQITSHRLSKIPVPLSTSESVDENAEEF